MKNRLNYFLVLCFLFSAFTSYAQVEGEVEDKTVIIEKEAKLDLPPANRNFEKIQSQAVRAEKKPQTYKFDDVEISLPKLSSKIKIPTIPPDPLPKLYGNYVKAGIGNYTTPYLEGFFNNKRSDKVNYGVHIKHYSSQNGSVKSNYFNNLSGTSQNQLNGNVKYFTDKSAFKGGLEYNRYKYNYYGFNQTVPVSEDSFNIRQVYNIFSLNAGLENLDKTSDLGYDANVRFYNFSDKFKATEQEFLGDLNLKYNLGDGKGLSMNTVLSQSKRKDSSSISRTFFITKPAFYFIKDKLDFRLGFNAAYTSDTIKIYNKFHLYPSANLNIHVIEKEVIAFVGLDGEMQKNTLRTLVMENPYLGQNIPLFNTNKSLELYAGIKGNLNGILNYKLRAAYANYKNLYFFNNSATDTSKFNVFYDRGNTTVKNFNLEVAYEVSNQLRLGLNSNYNSYTVSSDSISAWHRPNFTNSILATYNLNQKIYFNVDFFYIGGLTARNFVSSPKKDRKLDPIVDLNLKIDYKVSSAFSAFIEINNILNKKYQRYQYYYVKGLNVLAGVTYSF